VVLYDFQKFVRLRLEILDDLLPLIPLERLLNLDI